MIIINMSIEKKTEVSPEELFNEILLELSKRDKVRFHVNLKNWHRAYYDAKLKYPESMKGFEGLFREEPYFHEITECFHEFVEAHHLSRIIPDGDCLINDPERMRFNFPPHEKVQEIARYICDRI